MIKLSTVREYLRANKHRNKDVVIYDYDSNNEYIITPSNRIYLKNDLIKSPNIKKYLNRLYILMEYNQGGAIFLQVNY